MKAISALLCILLLVACSQDGKDTALKLTGGAMGTHWQITISVPGDMDKDNLRQQIEAELDVVNRQFSTYLEDSEVSRFNALQSLAGEQVSPAVVEVTKAAQQISEQSNGAFDISVGPLVDLWGFGPEIKVDPPSQQQIDATKQVVGYRYLKFKAHPPSLSKEKKGLKIDFSSIAKGYGVDRLASLLEQQGILDYLVDIGGELRVKGLNPHEQLWRIAIEKPGEGQRRVHELIQLEDTAVATSGDYHNYFEQDGVRYSHTIDPATGRPITHKLASVTVLHESAMMADGLATAINVLGEKKGIEFANRQGLEVYMIVREADGFKVRTTFKETRYVQH